MTMGDFHSWWTVAMLVLFIGIVIWAWSGKRREEFDSAAHIPFEDDEPLVPADARGVPAGRNEEKRHG